VTGSNDSGFKFDGSTKTLFAPFNTFRRAGKPVVWPEEDSSSFIRFAVNYQLSLRRTCRLSQLNRALTVKFYFSLFGKIIVTKPENQKRYQN